VEIVDRSLSVVADEQSKPKPICALADDDDDDSGGASCIGRVRNVGFITQRRDAALTSQLLLLLLLSADASTLLLSDPDISPPGRFLWLTLLKRKKEY